MPDTSAVQFGFSPSHLVFQNSDMEMCREATLFSDIPVSVSVVDAWSDSQSSRVQDYSLSKKLLSYQPYVRVEGESTFLICLMNRTVEEHYGLIILNIENTSSSGGMWVRIEGERAAAYSVNSSIPATSSKRAIMLKRHYSQQDHLNHALSIILMVFVAILCSILLILMLTFRKKKLFGYRRGDPKTFIYSL